jgi:hypothetical protein
MLNGCDFLRLWHVDLLSLIGCTNCTHENLVSRFIDDLDVDLDICTTSIECVYGVSVGNDFRQLSMILLKCGRTFPDAVKEILGGKYGVYYNWRQAFLQLDSEYTAKRETSFSTLGLRSMTLDGDSDADR